MLCLPAEEPIFVALKKGVHMRLTPALLLIVAGLMLAASIEVGTSDVPSNNPWCGS